MQPFGAGSPSNIKSPGLRPTSIPSGILIHAAIWPQQIWAENCGGAVPLWEGELGPHLTQCDQGWCLSPYQVASWSIQLFGHNRYGPKTGGAVPFLVGGAWSPSNTMWPVPRTIQPFCHNRHGPRIIQTQALPASVNFESGGMLCLFPWGSWVSI